MSLVHRSRDQHFTPNLIHLMRVGGLLEWDQHFTPNLTQLTRVGGSLEWDQHFTPKLIHLMRVGGTRTPLFGWGSRVPSSYLFMLV